MKKIFILFLFLFGNITLILAQQSPADSVRKDALEEKPKSENEAGYSRIKRTEAKKSPKTMTQEQLRENLNNLKNGFLLVRLRTSENAIKSLEKAGNQTMANTVKVQQQKNNLRLKAAFRENFTYCPVYFFYSSDSDKLLRGETKGILLNENLEKDSSLTFPQKPFLVAELTDVQPSNADRIGGASGENTFRALVLRDNQLQQLKRPFPFFVKASQSFPPEKRSEAQMVALLNKKLLKATEKANNTK